MNDQANSENPTPEQLNMQNSQIQAHVGNQPRQMPSNLPPIQTQQLQFPSQVSSVKPENSFDQALGDSFVQCDDKTIPSLFMSDTENKALHGVAEVPNELAESITVESTSRLYHGAQVVQSVINDFYIEPTQPRAKIKVEPFDNNENKNLGESFVVADDSDSSNFSDFVVTELDEDLPPQNVTQDLQKIKSVPEADGYLNPNKESLQKQNTQVKVGTQKDLAAGLQSQGTRISSKSGNSRVKDDLQQDDAMEYKTGRKWPNYKKILLQQDFIEEVKQNAQSVIPEVQPISASGLVSQVEQFKADLKIKVQQMQEALGKLEKIEFVEQTASMIADNQKQQISTMLGASICNGQSYVDAQTSSKLVDLLQGAIGKGSQLSSISDLSDKENSVNIDINPPSPKVVRESSKEQLDQLEKNSNRYDAEEEQKNAPASDTCSLIETQQAESIQHCRLVLKKTANIVCQMLDAQTRDLQPSQFLEAECKEQSLDAAVDKRLVAQFYLMDRLVAQLIELKKSQRIYMEKTDALHNGAAEQQAYSNQSWKQQCFSSDRGQVQQFVNNLIDSIVNYQECLGDISKGYVEIIGEFRQAQSLLKNNKDKYLRGILKKIFGAELPASNINLGVMESQSLGVEQPQHQSSQYTQSQANADSQQQYTGKSRTSQSGNYQSSGQSSLNLRASPGQQQNHFPDFTRQGQEPLDYIGQRKKSVSVSPLNQAARQGQFQPWQTQNIQHQPLLQSSTNFFPQGAQSTFQQPIPNFSHMQQSTHMINPQHPSTQPPYQPPLSPLNNQPQPTHLSYAQPQPSHPNFHPSPNPQFLSRQS